MPFRNVFAPLMTTWVTIAAAVFVIVTGLLLYAILRNRAGRRAKLPFAASSNTALEVAYAVLLGGVAAALATGSFLTISQLNEGVGLAADTAAPGTPTTRVDVTAFRWCWDFSYPGTGVDRTGDCTAGEYPTVVVPAGQPVEFAITSRDVVHAFWLPDFDAKMDAYPNHENTLRMVFPEPGRFRGRCSEFCGIHHASMDFWVQVVSPAQYQQFLASGGASA